MSEQDKDAEWLLEISNEMQFGSLADWTHSDAERMRSIAAYLRANIPVPVSERLPELNQDVLVFENFRQRWYEGLLDVEGHLVIDGHYIDSFFITHWLPMPNAPEQPQ